jgi:signal transduction histidine kinase
VKAIAEAHHGTVQVRSTLGQGSVFELRLPAPMALADSRPASERWTTPS